MPPRVEPAKKVGRVEGDHQKTKDYDERTENAQKKKFTYFFTKIELEEINAQEKAATQTKENSNKGNLLINSNGGMTQYNTKNPHFPTPDAKTDSLLASIRDKKDSLNRTLVKPKVEGMFDAHLVQFSYVQNPNKK